MKHSHNLHTNLEQYFTNDAWKQFQSYLDTLLSELQDYNIDNKYITTTFQGIKEYVEGYYHELPENARISFKQSLVLVDEIGTPSEILQELYLQSDSDTVGQSTTTSAEPIPGTFKHCTECGARLPTSEVHCKYCGRDTTLESRQFSPRMQYMIDKPYTAGLGIAFGIAAFLVLSAIIGLIIGVFSGWQISISIDFGIIIITVIILSILGLLIGSVIDGLYGDYISFSQRYERLVESFNNKNLTGHLIFAISVFAYAVSGILIRNIMIGSPEGNIMASLVPIFSVIYVLIVITMQSKPEPSTIPYYELLVLKKKTEDHVRNSLWQFNKWLFVPLFLISQVWHFMVFDQFYVQSSWFAVPGYLMFAFLAFAINGIYYAYLYSWTTVLQLNTPASDVN